MMDTRQPKLRILGDQDVSPKPLGFDNRIEPPNTGLLWLFLRMVAIPIAVFGAVLAGALVLVELIELVGGQ